MTMNRKSKKVDIENIISKTKARNTQISKAETNKQAKKNLLLEKLLATNAEPISNEKPLNEPDLVYDFFTNTVYKTPLNEPDLVYDYITNTTYKLTPNLKVKIPSDNNNILKSIDDCFNLLKALTPLGIIVLLRNEFDYRKSIYIGDDVKAFNQEKNNILKENLLLKIKLETLYLITKIAGIANEFLIQKQFTYEEFKALISITDVEAKLEKVDEIELTDLSDILEGISRVFPEFKIPEINLPVIEPQLFSNGRNLEPTPSNVIYDVFYGLCVGNLELKNEQNQITKEIDLTVEKTFSKGKVKLILLNQFKEELEIRYGQDTFKVLCLLGSYAIKYEHSLDKKITVSGRDLLTYLNKLYARNPQGKRLKKDENLAWLSKQGELIRSVIIYIGEYTVNRKQIKINSIPLIEFSNIASIYQLDIFGEPDKENIDNLVITYKLGDWVKYFYDPNGEYVKQFGFSHKEVLVSAGLTADLGNWLTFKLEQNQKGDFKIKTVLESIGLKELLHTILSEKNSSKKAFLSKNLFNRFNKTVSNLKCMTDPYQIEYRDPPTWLTNPSERKPKGWFLKWLDCVIIFKHPLCLIGEGKGTRREKNENKPKKQNSKLSVEDLKSALASNPKVSIRKLSSWYGESFSWLQRRLKKGNFNQNEIRDLLNGIKHLSKK